MLKHIDILGHPTWISVADNDRDRLVLLHGGLSSSSDLKVVGELLESKFRICAFDRRGHGRTADTSAPFHYESMANETIAFLEAIGGASDIVGWSDGGNVALFVALRRPDLVKRLVIIGSNFHHDGVLGGNITEAAKQLITNDYAEKSPDGPSHREVVLSKTLKMWQNEPTLTTNDLARVSVPVLVMVGDDDGIHLSHTCALYENMPHAQLAIIPGASHFLPIEQPAKVAKLVDDFLKQELPVVTLMPCRRFANHL
jgi:pimeloyl-ACP methyl ester carboxylesterase